MNNPINNNNLNLENLVKPKEMITGRITNIDRNYVYFDISLKSDVMAPIGQFTKDELEIGKEVKLLVITLDNGSGLSLVSREKARLAESVEYVTNAYKTDQIVIGTISHKINRGYVVNIQGLKAFLPISLSGGVAWESDRSVELKVLRIEDNNSIIVSHQAVLSSRHAENYQRIMSNLQEGDVLSGTVKNLADFGAFVDLGGIDGMIHIADISWSRIKHPKEVLNLGDQVQVKVIKFDGERISLSLKALKPNPWDTVDQLIKVGDVVTGKITSIAEYGCFVSINDELEGLVHQSAFDWFRKHVNVSNYVKLGEEIQAMIKQIDKDKKRISLSIKECLPHPWKEFAKNNKPGQIITGKVKSISEIGIFVDLPNNTEGLVYISDISWDKNFVAKDHFNKGDDIQVKILEIDIKRCRISLSLKSLNTGTFEYFVQNYKVGSKVQATISKLGEHEAIINLLPEVQITLPIEEVKNALPNPRENDTFSLKITEIGDNPESIKVEIKQVAQSIGSMIKNRLQNN